VLVGDFLFAKSFSIMVEAGSLSVLRVLSDATTRMAEGEVLQLIGTCDPDLDEERYMAVVRNKTAVLIAAACQCGGILGAVSEEQQQALSAFGMDLGIAFQFMDDALDYVAEAEFGKERGQDLAEGKMTLPLIHALRRCTTGERERMVEIIAGEQLADADLVWAIELIQQHGGIDYTRQRATEMVNAAKRHLALFADGPVRSALMQLADYVVSRRK
jgi:octaprenyl-diphosphate synthase